MWDTLEQLKNWLLHTVDEIFTTYIFTWMGVIAATGFQILCSAVCWMLYPLMHMVIIMIPTTLFQMVHTPAVTYYFDIAERYASIAFAIGLVWLYFSIKVSFFGCTAFLRIIKRW